MSEEILGSHMPTITRLLDERKELKGDIAEFGVYMGATTVQLAQLTPRRYVWAFDTFDGIPAEDFTAGLDIDEPGKFAPEPEAFRRFSQYPNIAPIMGRFEDTLPQIHPKTQIALAYLDCDLYKSAKCALEWLADHLVTGGVIVFDDYDTHEGIRRAIAEFMLSHGSQEAGIWFDHMEVIYWGRP